MTFGLGDAEFSRHPPREMEFRHTDRTGDQMGMA